MQTFTERQKNYYYYFTVPIYTSTISKHGNEGSNIEGSRKKTCNNKHLITGRKRHSNTTSKKASC